MQSFYQPHVREPVFLAMVHAGLWALDDQDFGVSLASAVGSMLAIFATYLVGAALLSPAAGLLAALLTATELEMVTWGVDGWRDDTFTATIFSRCGRCSGCAHGRRSRTPSSPARSVASRA